MGLLFRLFRRNEPSGKKLAELEKKISVLENQLKQTILIDKETLIEILEKLNSPQTEAPATIQIDHLQVDKIIIEKLDYANNFGQLGIKELSGKLTIGTSYEGDFAKEISEKLNEKLGNQAKVNFRSKVENE
jgi:hypothetical protein